MGNLTITIESNADIRYSHVPPVVRHGDTVTFQVQDVPGSVEVRFDDGSCLTTTGPYELLGGPGLTAASPQPVSPGATARRYPFTATLPDSRGKKIGEHEVKKGEIDVTTDPPTEFDKK